MDYEKKNKNFNIWLQQPMKRTYPTYANNYKYLESNFVYYKYNLVKKKTFVNNFIDQINSIITKNSYTINNDKQFRNEIASFIYKYSDNE